MSLDVFLKTTVYSDNITHNLNKMAEAAGIYDVLWRPDENGIWQAQQLIQPLSIGLAQLVSNPDKFKQFNAPNGWGMYENFVPFVSKYLAACVANPEASVSVSR